MIVPDKIKKVAEKSDFVFWTSTVGRNSVCDLTRVSGFVVEDDNEYITFFLPEKLFSLIKPNLSEGSNISLLMASLKDFESYQVKGKYVSHTGCTEEKIDYYRLKVLKIIDMISGMGLNGNRIFGFLLEQPSIAVSFQCTESYLQTPKPGTGTELKD